MSITRPILPFEDRFTQIPNAWLRDARLSLRARGLLSELMSHAPGWKVSIRSLVASETESPKAVMSAVKELRKFGYLTVVQERSKGQSGEVNYLLSDPTEQTSAANGKPACGSAAPKASMHVKTNSKEDETPNVGSGSEPKGASSPSPTHSSTRASNEQVKVLYDHYVSETDGLPPDELLDEWFDMSSADAHEAIMAIRCGFVPALHLQALDPKTPDDSDKFKDPF